MIQSDKILLKTIVSEKAVQASSEYNQYAFKVHPEANRIAIARAVEKAFGVHVLKVNIMNAKPKAKRDRMRRGRVATYGAHKKAIVKLAEGESLDIV